MESYSYTQTTSNPALSLISFAIIVLIIVASWRIFAKCGESGWKAIIPFYNAYTKYKLFWGNGWLFLLGFVPVVNIIVQIILTHKMSKAFGHKVGFTLGLIFLPFIFYLILGFNSDEYLGPQ